MSARLKVREIPLFAFMGVFILVGFLVGFIAGIAWEGLRAGMWHAEQMFERIFTG